MSRELGRRVAEESAADAPARTSVRRRDRGELLGPAVLELARPEQWALDQVRRRGIRGFVAQMTLVAVLLSMAIVTVIMIVAYGTDPEFVVPGVVMAAVTPAMVAPPVLVFSVRLVARLDAAGHLLRRAASTDPLTGVANRRGFFEALHALGAGGEVVEIAMIDLDNFKELNDRHGHAVGDEALRGVADWLVELVGDAGTVARMGGDEFAYIATFDPERPLPPRQGFARAGVAYSATIGRAVHAPGDDPERALLDADADLYRHKSSRNDGGRHGA